MRKDKIVIIRIDSYFLDSLIIGKAGSAGQIKSRMIHVLEMAEIYDFLSIFCAKYNFEILSGDENPCIDYIMDLDTHLVYRPR